MTRRLQWALLATGFMALCACAPVRVRENPASLADQQRRESQLASRTRWTLTAHIFVSDGTQNSGSGDLEWQHDGDRYTFKLRAPTGRTWRLTGDSREAVLEGVDAQPIRGTDPERLLRERLGWDVPVADLADWVRGVRSPRKPAQVVYDALSLPAQVDQDGWKVEYRDWYADLTPPMPHRVFASHGDARVKMSIDHWSFDG